MCSPRRLASGAPACSSTAAALGAPAAPHTAGGPPQTSQRQGSLTTTHHLQCHETKNAPPLPTNLPTALHNEGSQQGRVGERADDRCPARARTGPQRRRRAPQGRCAGVRGCTWVVLLAARLMERADAVSVLSFEQRRHATGLRCTICLQVFSQQSGAPSPLSPQTTLGCTSTPRRNQSQTCSMPRRTQHNACVFIPPVHSLRPPPCCTIPIPHCAFRHSFAPPLLPPGCRLPPFLCPRPLGPSATESPVTAV